MHVNKKAIIILSLGAIAVVFWYVYESTKEYSVAERSVEEVLISEEVEKQENEVTEVDDSTETNVVTTPIPSAATLSPDVSAEPKESEKEEVIESKQTFELSFTPEEVASHASKESCYTIVDGNVYDITVYIPHHPGGESAAMASCGIDATELFYGVSHHAGDDAVSTLSLFKIGVLKEE